METAAVRVETEAEPNVRAVVVRKDLLSMIFEDAELDFGAGKALEVLDRGSCEAIRWIFGWYRLHRASILNIIAGTRVAPLWSGRARAERRDLS